MLITRLIIFNKIVYIISFSVYNYINQQNFFTNHQIYKHYKISDSKRMQYIFLIQFLSKKLVNFIEIIVEKSVKFL